MRISDWSSDVCSSDLCYAAYRYRITRFTIVPTDKGNLCVIDDADGQRILEQIESHRARQFRSEYDFMPEGDSPEQHRARFKWLHKEGALSDDELRQRMATVDALDPARMGDRKSRRLNSSN